MEKNESGQINETDPHGAVPKSMTPGYPIGGSVIKGSEEAVHHVIPSADGGWLAPPTDEEQSRGLGPEDGTGMIAGGPAGNVITCNFTGTAQAGVLAWDQWWMFSLLADQPVNATYVIGTVDVISEDGVWTPALTSLYLGLAPLFMTNFNVTAASANAVVSGMQVRIRKSDPFGETAGNLQPQAAYQNAADFQRDRGQFPIAQPINSWTWCRIVSPIQAVAATFTGAFFFGPRPDPLQAVPRVAPQIVRSVNR